MLQFEIDQSGKVEQTEVNTILAVVNDSKYSILFKKKDKRLVWAIFKRLGRQKLFALTVFSALLSILLRQTRINKAVLVDREYYGHDEFILRLFLQYSKNKD